MRRTRTKRAQFKSAMQRIVAGGRGGGGSERQKSSPLARFFHYSQLSPSVTTKKVPSTPNQKKLLRWFTSIEREWEEEQEEEKVSPSFFPFPSGNGNKVQIRSVHGVKEGKKRETPFFPTARVWFGILAKIAMHHLFQVVGRKIQGNEKLLLLRDLNPVPLPASLMNLKFRDSFISYL